MEKKKVGGARPGSGRKPKADEQQLIEKLSLYDDEAHRRLFDAIDGGHKWAVELFFKYRYGMPRQMVDVTTNGNDIAAPVIAFKSFTPDEQE